MCLDPATMATIGTITAVAGTGVQVVGSMRDANAANAAARANQRVADQQAQVERDATQFNVAQQRRDQRRFLAQNRVAASAQGTALTGQAIDLLASSVRQAEIDNQAVRFSGEIRATGLETQGRLDRFGAQQARSGGFMRAGTALLTGASRIGGRLGSRQPTQTWTGQAGR